MQQVGDLIVDKLKTFGLTVDVPCTECPSNWVGRLNALGPYKCQKQIPTIINILKQQAANNNLSLSQERASRFVQWAINTSINSIKGKQDVTEEQTE